MSFQDLIKKLDPTFSRATNPGANNIIGASGSGGGNLMYPSDLFTPGNEPYILFYRRDPLAIQPKIIRRMALYMPPTLSVTYGAQYQEIEMTLYQYEDIGQDVYDMGRKAVAGGAPISNERFKRGIAQGAANISDYIIGTNFADQVRQINKRTINPHMALLFKGMDFRTFTFTFQMMARNEKESQEIQEIIKEFKTAMHPADDQESNRYWIYPDNFDIFLFSAPAEQTQGPATSDGQGPAAAASGSKYLFNISTAALVNMSVDYAGSGVPSFFKENGAPVDIRMSLTFKELEVLTRKRIEENY